MEMLSEMTVDLDGRRKRRPLQEAAHAIRFWLELDQVPPKIDYMENLNHWLTHTDPENMVIWEHDFINGELYGTGAHSHVG
jgi:hypothetical protein